MDKNIFDNKRFLAAYFVVVAPLIPNTGCITLWFIGTDEKIQIGSDILGLTTYGIGWIVAVIPLLLLAANVFWIKRLHVENQSCDAKLTLLPDRVLKVRFVKGFWQKEPYSEVLLQY